MSNVANERKMSKPRLIANSITNRYVVALEFQMGCVIKIFKSPELQSKAAVDSWIAKYTERFPDAKYRGEIHLVQHKSELAVYLNNEALWSDG